TAVNTALEATDKLRDTADALGRAFVVEVMGRHSGMLALQVGLAAGAVEVLVPEIPVDLRHVAHRIYDGFKRGRRSSIIVVAEGFGEGGAVEVAKAISTYSPLDCRVTVLGHIQRGGDPTAFDRVLGGVLGDGAIEGLLKGYTCHMVGQAHQAIVFVPLEDTWKKHRYPSEQQLHLLKELSG
ncbi:MAG: 6-phosphofructokinase, partial [Chloroflexi bacterium]|nr:6-phosphofructokinase [Chloroflexota bacterium]